jgi:hypothetical protein
MFSSLKYKILGGQKGHPILRHIYISRNPKKIFEKPINPGSLSRAWKCDGFSGKPIKQTNAKNIFNHIAF